MKHSVVTLYFTKSLSLFLYKYASGHRETSVPKNSYIYTWFIDSQLDEDNHVCLYCHLYEL